MAERVDSPRSAEFFVMGSQTWTRRWVKAVARKIGPLLRHPKDNASMKLLLVMAAAAGCRQIRVKIGHSLVPAGGVN